jgi:hypothetical protein
MEAIHSSETLVTTYMITRRHNQKKTVDIETPIALYARQQ